MMHQEMTEGFRRALLENPRAAVAEVEKTRDMLGRAMSRLAEALEVLRAVEWVAKDVAPGLVRAFCPLCAQPAKARSGHAPDCRLAAVLEGKT